MVASDCLDIVVAGDRPEARAVGFWVPVDRRVRTKPRELFVRLGAGVSGDGQQVDLHRRTLRASAGCGPDAELLAPISAAGCDMPCGRTPGSLSGPRTAHRTANRRIREGGSGRVRRSRRARRRCPSVEHVGWWRARKRFRRRVRLERDMWGASIRCDRAAAAESIARSSGRATAVTTARSRMNPMRLRR